MIERAHRRILFASMVGTAIEFYDFYVYATAAALVFGPLFFPSHDPALQLLSSYASFGIAFIARPVGSVLFGHFGDRVGRKSTLVASLMLMGVSTFLIAFLPTHDMVGWVAPVLLCLLRFGQGLGLGGEWGGAALLAVENAPPGWKGRYGTAPQFGAPVGFIAANGLFLLIGLGLDQQQFLDWGWRIPFLFSAALVIIGLWVRLKLTETPDFTAAKAAHETERVPIAELVRHHGWASFCGTFAAVACFALFYIATAFALGHGTSVQHHDRNAFLSIQLVAILFLAAGILVSGIWSDKTSPGRVLRIGSVATIVVGLLMGVMMGSGSLAETFVFLSLALFVMGLVYGPLGAWLPALFPTRVRYTGASVAFNAAGIIGGAMAPVVAQWLADKGGLGLVGLYLSAAGLLSLIGLLGLKPQR
jgi:MFS family permease